VPRHTASAWADYTVHDGKLKGFGVGAGARYVGSSWGDTANTLKVPGYTLFDAAVHYDIPNIARLKDNGVVLVTWRDIQKAMYPTP